MRLPPSSETSLAVCRHLSAGAGVAGAFHRVRRMERDFHVYILASQRNGTLYVGVTSDLAGRIHTHREDLVAGFTRRYGVHQLVWFEPHGNAESAILREKQLKKWNRAWKLRLIEASNPTWDDLYPGLFG